MAWDCDNKAQQILLPALDWIQIHKGWTSRFTVFCPLHVCGIHVVFSNLMFGNILILTFIHIQAHAIHLFLSIPCFKNLSIMPFLFKEEKQTILVMCVHPTVLFHPCPNLVCRRLIVQTSLILVLPSWWTEIIVWLH